MALTVTLLGKIPFATVGGIAFSIWQFRLDATPPDAGGLTAGERIGLGLSSGIDIKDPAGYPNVPQLAGMWLQTTAGQPIQYAGGTVDPSLSGVVDIAFIAPAADDPFTAMVLVSPATGTGWQELSFILDPSSTPGLVQAGRGPAQVVVATGQSAAVYNGRSADDFRGALPYASELFGVYQPLAGWIGFRPASRVLAARSDGGPAETISAERFSGESAQTLDDPLLALLARAGAAPGGILSPVGLVHLFREYFFEFDSFLGPPSGHIWLSPGGTVEVVEVSTRKTIVEQTTEVSIETTHKTEESLTRQDDLADAVKEDNSNDTKLGATVSAGGSFAGIYHADASASFSNDSSRHHSQEETHKHSRTQSEKVSSEIRRQFKTTFRTVTETTDTQSRRYVVQNTTDRLANYELRRKLRKVGVQVQHIGTRLSWQVFLDTPGRPLGLGEMVHVVPSPDTSALKPPERPTPLKPIETDFTGYFPLMWRTSAGVDPPHNDREYRPSPGDPSQLDDVDSNTDHIEANYDYFAAPPNAGYTLVGITLKSAKTGGGEARFSADFIVLDIALARFQVHVKWVNFGANNGIDLDLTLTWAPPDPDPAFTDYQDALAAYQQQLDTLLRQSYANAVRDRLKLVSNLRPRPSEDLRAEERDTVYGALVQQLRLGYEPHITSELVRQIFDVDEMLYFVAPDYWRPRQPPYVPSPKYPVPPYPPVAGVDQPLGPLAGETVLGWYGSADQDWNYDSSGALVAETRADYLITEETQPAPMGSSLAWLIQIDGDERRNEFLNSAWVKAVLPIRPGHELEALAWLAAANVEGEAGLGQPYPMQPGDPPGYQGKTIGQVLALLAAELQASNTDIANTLDTEKVFETGFDPLQGGFRTTAPYEVFDQWIEVLPTDQIVAVDYDPALHGGL